MTKQDKRSLLLIIAIGFFLCLFSLLWHAVPGENRDYVLIMIGALAGAFSVLTGVKPVEPPIDPKL